MRLYANQVKQSSTKRAKELSWALLLLLGGLGSFSAVKMTGSSNALASLENKGTFVEEMGKTEKKREIARLLKEGDRYREQKRYELANAVYEEIFVLDQDNAEASDRIDLLKSIMLSEGRAEIDVVKSIHEEEIEARVRIYWKMVGDLVAAKRWGQARFTLEKLLLLDPLHQEAAELYQRLKQATADGIEPEALLSSAPS